MADPCRGTCFEGCPCHEARVKALADALEKLANEVEGLGFREAEIREAIGNTNWSVLQVKRVTAEVALSAWRGEGDG